MLLKEVMTKGVAEISAQATIHDAAEQMRSHDIGALPVCKDNRLVGILTDRDIAIRAVAGGCDPDKAYVGDIMTPGITWCYDDDSVENAAALMEQKQIRRLLVLDHNKNIAGIVSLGDLARFTHNPHLNAEVLQRISEPKNTSPPN